MNVKWLWINLRVSSFMLINSVSFQSCQNYSEVQQVSLSMGNTVSLSTFAASHHICWASIVYDRIGHWWKFLSPAGHLLPLHWQPLPMHQCSARHCLYISKLHNSLWGGGKAGRDLSFFLILNSNLEGHHKWDSWSPMNYLADFPWSFLLSVAYRH